MAAGRADGVGIEPRDRRSGTGEEQGCAPRQAGRSAAARDGDFVIPITNREPSRTPPDLLVRAASRIDTGGITVL
jgi:hypothetical protein